MRATQVSISLSKRVAVLTGNPIVGDAKETNKALSQEWKTMDADEREVLTDRLRREHFKAEAEGMKDELTTSQQRERFLQDQADSLSTLVSPWSPCYEMSLIKPPGHTAQRSCRPYHAGHAGSAGECCGSCCEHVLHLQFGCDRCLETT
jgi:hypothetical protein